MCSVFSLVCAFAQYFWALFFSTIPTPFYCVMFYCARYYVWVCDNSFLYFSLVLGKELSLLKEVMFKFRHMSHCFIIFYFFFFIYLFFKRMSALFAGFFCFFIFSIVIHIQIPYDVYLILCVLWLLYSELFGFTNFLIDKPSYFDLTWQFL